MKKIKSLFGDIDIYLFDQILKDRFSREMVILDAGCGSGRNIVYFLQNDFEVFAVDQSPDAIGYIRNLAETLAPKLASENFRVSSVENLTFSDESFDAVISSAVLHFAADHEHFISMLNQMWRVLRPGGLFFARLASSIGIENLIKPVGSGKFLLPDGSTRFLVDEDLLISLTNDFGATLLEPIKTTNVQNLRCMTTWVLRKN